MLIAPAAPSASSAAASSAACWRSRRPSSASRSTSSRPTRTARPSTSPPDRTIAPYDDEAALGRLRGAVDAVTYEFENVPSATAAILRSRRAPQPEPARPRDDPGPARREELRRRPRHPDRALRGDRRRRPDLAAALAGDRPARRPEDPALRLRRQGPGHDSGPRRTRRPGRRSAARPAILEGFVAVLSARSRSSRRAAPDGAFAAYRPLRQRAPPPHPRRHPRARRRVAQRPQAQAVAMTRRDRRRARLCRRAGGGDVRGPRTAAEALVVNEIAPAGAQFGALDDRGRASPRSSSSTCARSAAGRSATAPRRPIEMRNLIGRRRRAWRSLLARARRPSSPLRQARSPARAQDGSRDAGLSWTEAARRGARNTGVVLVRRRPASRRRRPRTGSFALPEPHNARTARADSCPGQQRRPGASRAQEEDAARGDLSRDEAPRSLEKPSEKQAREKAEAVRWPAS